MPCSPLEPVAADHNRQLGALSFPIIYLEGRGLFLLLMRPDVAPV